MGRGGAKSRTQEALPFPQARGRRRRSRTLERAEREALVERLNRDGTRIAAHFGLKFRAILAERAGVVGHYGICYEDGLIKIRLQHATRGTPLKYSSLVNTLCHELAHLRYFDHQENFRRFYARLLDWAREQGIYRPRGAPPQRPCGVTAGERRRILARLRQAVSGGRQPPGAAAGEQLPLFGRRLDPSG